jgi:hypothetical protein
MERLDLLVSLLLLRLGLPLGGFHMAPAGRRLPFGGLYGAFH